MSSPGSANASGVDFQDVLEASQDLYALVAPDPPDFTLLAARDGYVRSAMRPREELIGRSIFDAFPQNPEVPEGQGGSVLSASFERVLRNKQTHSIGTFRYDAPDPQSPAQFAERYWSPRNIPVLDGEGEVRYILHRVDEVTDFVLRERFQAPRTSNVRGSKEGKHVLIAEADPGRRHYLEQLFTTQWHVQTAASAREALDEIQRHMPDVVFTGMDLPDLQGDELTKMLRQESHTSDLPVILTLAKASPRQFREAFRAGANEVVSGQASARELIARAEAQVAAAELRNPLTPIANIAQLLQLKKDDMGSTQLEEASTVLPRQITHLTRIVDDLLDLSRIDRGRITLQEEAVDLRGVVPQAVESIPSLHEGDSHDFAQSLPEHPLVVNGDPVRLTQVLTNLLDNAVKYTPSEGWIRLEASREGQWAVLRVLDNGSGIEPHFLPRLFDTFERGPNRSTQTMGLGLGLPLVRRLTELHGGTVEVHSPGSGQGSRFSVYLPAAEAQTERSGLTQEASAASSGRVLVVEDNEDVASSLRFLLEALGQEVEHAASGKAALEAMERSRPALVLLDIGLPDRNGFEVAGELRRSSRGTPLVALSGHPLSNFPDEPAEVFDEYLLKPPTLERLKQALSRMRDD
ncbi:response regulator [Thiohalorhabdus sp. Cl-TMA]|uniref:histidine kinase n=1 Tax=Thiohalorhabdus methylotrophus TaxID=3242694 RepID=A0ABV4TZF0_9GAMM